MEWGTEVGKKVRFMEEKGYSNHLIALMEKFYGTKYIYFTVDERKKVPVGMNEESAHVMQTVIKDLENYVKRGYSIHSFEQKYGSSPSQYVSKEKSRYYNAHKNANHKEFFRERSGYWKKYWKIQADKHEYQSMNGIYDFVFKLESILEKINRFGLEKPILIPDSIEILHSSDPQISNENKKLLKIYNDSIDKDIKKFKENRKKDTESDINWLRNTSLYNGKKIPHDKHRIGGENSVTFDNVFDRVRNLASSLSIRKDHSMGEFKGNDEFDKYLIRIKNLGKILSKYEKEYQDLVQKKKNYKIGYPEKEYFKKLEKEISTKIKELRIVYNQLDKDYNKYQKLVNHIDESSKRLEAIDKAIDVLNSDNNRNPENNVNIFNNTIKMLMSIRIKCSEEIEKYAKELFPLDKIFDNAETTSRSIADLLPKYGSLIEEVKNKKEQEAVSKRQQEIEKLKNRKSKLLVWKDKIYDAETGSYVNPNKDGKTHDKDGYPVFTTKGTRYVVTEDQFIELYMLMEQEVVKVKPDYKPQDVSNAVFMYLDKKCDGLEHIEHLSYLKVFADKYAKSIEDMDSQIGK